MRTKTALALVLILILIGLPLASAVKAKIGNSRMVLRPEVGEKVEKFIRVINDNPDPVNIEITATGDLAENVQFEEANFILEPNTEKNAIFTIFSNTAEKTETKILVAFKPDEGNGAGLASVVILIPEGEDIISSNVVKDIDTDNENINDEPKEDTGVTFGSNAARAPKTSTISDSSFEFTPVGFLIFSTVTLMIVLAILFGFYNFKSKKNKPPKEMTKRNA
jgi:hypothetical protein